MDRKLYSIVYICLQNMYISGNHGYHDVRRGLKIIHTTISKVNTTVIQWYTSVYRLSPEIWWWIITFLEKVWQLHTMMYAVDRKLYFPLSTFVSRDVMNSLWSSRYSWFENYFFHCLPIVSRDVHILEIMDAMMYAVEWKLYTPLSADCLQRCDDELLHSLKKSDWWIPWCTPWIENYTHHDIQSEYNGNTMVHICLPLSPEIWWWITFLESLTVAYHDVRRGLKLYSTISKVNTMIFICLPIVSRDVMISLWSLVIAISVEWKLYTPLSTDCLQRYDDELLHSLKVWLVNTMMYAVDRKLYTPLSTDRLQGCDDFTLVIAISVEWNYTHHCLQGCDEFTLIIAIFVDRNYIPLSSIVSRDVMMNYYIPWKSLTGAYHDVHRGLKLYTTIFKVNTMIFICLPNVSRDVMNYYIPWKSDSCIPWCTPWIENYTPLSSIVSRDMMMNSLWSSRYPWIEVIFPLSSIVSRDVMMNYYIPWKSDSCIPWCTPWIENYIPLSTDCLQRCTYSGNHGIPWCTPWIEIIFHCLPIVSRDVHILVIMVCHDVRRGLKLYATISKVNTIGTHLSADCLQGCDELLHSLKVWQVHTMMYTVDRNYIHHDIQSEYNGTHLSTDCLQRCDNELLHSLKKSLTGACNNAKWIQSENKVKQSENKVNTK